MGKVSARMACSLVARPPPPKPCSTRAKISRGSVWREAAEHGTDGEHGDAGHVEALASDAVGQPAGDGQHDGAGDQVAGEHPGGLLLAGAQAPAMWGRATLAMEVSSTSMNVASVTVMATSHGLWCGFQCSSSKTRSAMTPRRWIASLARMPHPVILRAGRESAQIARGSVE